MLTLSQKLSGTSHTTVTASALCQHIIILNCTESVSDACLVVRAVANTTGHLQVQSVRCLLLACRVNAICPGPTLTEGTKRHAASQGKSLEEAVKEMTSHMIMPR